MTFGRKGVSGTAGSAAPASQAQVPTPLFAAMQYIGMIAPPGSYVESVSSPQPCEGPGGARGVRFVLGTQDGPGYGFLFPSFGSVWISSEPGPRAQIPTEMIAGRVPGFAQALTVLLRG